MTSQKTSHDSDVCFKNLRSAINIKGMDGENHILDCLRKTSTVVHDDKCVKHINEGYREIAGYIVDRPIVPKFTKKVIAGNEW